MKEDLKIAWRNFKGYLGEHVTFALEFRNRIFTGDMVKSNDKYSDIIGTDPGC